jgi:hypothetical protein
VSWPLLGYYILLCDSVMLMLSNLPAIIWRHPRSTAECTSCVYTMLKHALKTVVKFLTITVVVCDYCTFSNKVLFTIMLMLLLSL